jgi:hypothetical protein
VEKVITVNFTHPVPDMPPGDYPGFYTPEKAQGGSVPQEQWFADHVIVEYRAADGSCLLCDPSYGVSDSGATVDLAQLAWGAQAIAAGVQGDWVAEGGFLINPTTGAFILDANGNRIWTGYVQGSNLFEIEPRDFVFTIP